MDYAALKIIGKSLYQINIPKEMKRYLVFLGRCCLHKEEVEGLQHFFAANALRQKLLAGNPAFLEQTTRSFFYKDATWQERINLVENHVKFLESVCRTELLTKIYCEQERIVLWEDTFEGKPLVMSLEFNAGQRKEGCLSLTLHWEKAYIYQIMFWLGAAQEKKQKALWIGALQGTALGNDIVKAMTKQYFGYRTKNLIFYGARQLAALLGCQKIYAVTNAGYYAMNHVRVNRKLKTDFGVFWQECGGTLSTDPRFFVIPLEEKRKEMAELKPSKRANHRRRYEMLDALSKTMEERMTNWLR